MEYEPIATHKSSQDSDELDDYSFNAEKRRFLQPSRIALNRTQVALIVTHTTTKFRSVVDPDPLYCAAAPAQSSIEYQRALLLGPFKDIDANLFSGFPNEENNAAWEKLLQVGIVEVDEDEAAPMEDPSGESPSRPGKVKFGLDVFHQLHCLWNLRKSTFPDFPWEKTAGGNNYKDMIHADHCLDYLRQSVMCHADISPIPWRWNSTLQNLQPDARILHSCRDFSKIYDWAAEHAPGGESLPSFQEAGLQPLAKGPPPCPKPEFCE